MSTPGAIDPAELLAQVSSESALALSSALERVNTLAHTGRIGRSGLRALREEIERARRAGLLGQQIHRIGSDRVRIHEERVDLASMLQDALAQRGREFEAKSIALNQRLAPMLVVGDITVIFAMIGALLDWCHEHASGQLDVTLEHKVWESMGTLSLAFAPAASDEPARAGAVGTPEMARTLSWRLVEVCARKLDLTLERGAQAGRQFVQIGFARTVATTSDVETLLDASLDDAPSKLNSRPLAGSHLLVVCARRELRVEIREAVQSMALMVDFVGSVDEAREFCAGGMPHAIVFEAPLGGAAMHRLMSELRADAPAIGFVEITESGKPLQTSAVAGVELPSVARPSLREALPSALTAELTRSI